jgi:hypothetical protein
MSSRRVTAWLACAVLGACSGPATVSPSAPQPLTVNATPAVAGSARELRRMVPPEAYLRAYIVWFGGLAPKQIQTTAHPGALFDTWNDYLAALGLPEYKRDLPRQEQTNALMLATLGRLGEALCARAVEHDLAGRPAGGEHVVFKFDAAPALDQPAFTQRFDQLHRKFLGYPARLAPADRVPRFFALYRDVVARHAGEAKPLTAEQAGWAAVCTALIQHPEAELY